MSEPNPAPALGKSPQAKAARPRGLLIVSIVGGALLLFVALALILFLGLRDLFSQEQETNPGIPLEVVKLTPTVATSPLPPPQTTCETIISSGDVEMAVSLPVSLTVNGEPFPVVAIVSGEEEWAYPADQQGVAAWLCGTVINYVLALEPTPENEALLTALSPGNEINLQLSNGAVLFFRFVERREAAPGEVSALEQKRPRLTLILDKNGVRQIATADYAADIEQIEPPSSETLAYPGQAVRVADVRVMVIKGHAERGAPDLSPGTMYYLVEFSVENIGDAPLEADAFTMQLKDDMETPYVLSPVASAAGEHGPLSGQIDPGATVQGTAGYLVPDPLAGPSLLWTFTAQPGSEARANVSIPYETETEPETAGHAEITIVDAFLDGDMLMIEGEIQNTGGSPITVEVGDISLSSSAGMSALQSAAPQLPWIIQPGQSQVIELQYPKPDASAALLELLGHSFEIAGL
jgi:hypothetical protein